MSSPYPPDPSGQNPYDPTRQSSSYDPYQQPQTYPQYNQPAPGSSGSYNPYQQYSQSGSGVYSQSGSGAYGPSMSQPQIVVNVQQGQTQAQSQMQPMLVAVAPPTNGKATAAMILGLCTFVAWVLTGIPAIILGHMALNEINASNGMQGGRGQAITGLILGYISAAGLAICVFCYMLGGLAALSSPH